MRVVCVILFILYSIILSFFFLMIRRPPRSTRTDTLFPYTTLFRSVSDMAADTPVRAMTLEHYPGMTERQLEAIEAEARRRWPLDACLIVHRYGRLEPGDRIVLVATASAHREAAFQACHFLIDWLKTKAPFWKQEETPEGARWVEA